MALAFPDPTEEGLVPFHIPSVDKPCFTHYKLYGDLTKGTPMVGLHGGPGFGMFRQMGMFWPTDGIPVLLYDQIGCGESSRLPEKHGDETFWNIDLFIAELKNILDHFGLHDGNGFYLVGASFGAIFGSDYATSRPLGLRKLVLCSPFASKRLLDEGHRRRRRTLPLHIQEALDHGDSTNEVQSAIYKNALNAYHRDTMLRADPWPQEFEEMADKCYKSSVYQTMCGPGPTVLGVGSMLGWSVVPRLHEINVPTLLINGEFDTAFEGAVLPFFERIPHVRWITYPNTSHGVMLESLEAVQMVARFLKQPDQP